MSSNCLIRRIAAHSKSIGIKNMCSSVEPPDDHASKQSAVRLAMRKVVVKPKVFGGEVEDYVNKRLKSDTEALLCKASEYNSKYKTKEANLSGSTDDTSIRTN